MVVFFRSCQANQLRTGAYVHFYHAAERLNYVGEPRDDACVEREAQANMTRQCYDDAGVLAF
jgi:hypothetical protein